MIGLYFVYMLSGTAFVETIFALPGLGRLAVTATVAHDVPVVLGTTIFFTLMVVFVNLVIDLAYGWLNPKLRVR
jgi:peptide/nickel transport system permease protein